MSPEGCILPGRVSSSVPSHWVLWALDILPLSLSLRAGMAGTARRKLVAWDPAVRAEGMDLCSEEGKGSVWERSLVHVFLPDNFVLLFCWSALYKPFHQRLGFYLRRVWNSQQAEHWASLQPFTHCEKRPSSLWVPASSLSLRSKKGAAAHPCSSAKCRGPRITSFLGLEIL